MPGNSLMVMTVILLILIGSRSRRASLGTDGHQLVVKLASGEILTVAPERLVYDRRSIAFETHLFPVNGLVAPTHEPGDIETCLAPLLSRATKLSSTEMCWYRLPHREFTLMATYLCFALCAALFIVTGAGQPFWAKLLKSIGAGQ